MLQYKSVLEKGKILDTILWILLALLVGLLYLLLKPQGATRGKSKAQKQDELLLAYKERMDRELSPYLKNETLLLEKKMALLKVFATELNNNIFFDKDESKALIQELVLYRIKKV
jgi:hypothetical protein